jgi:3-methylfumaryl-CoA hydratase
MTVAATSRVSAKEFEQWRSHIGRVRTQRQILDVSVLRRFAAATGADPEFDKTEPPMAHWAYFLDTVGSDGLGEDGHPLRGGFLPAVHLPRRMFAAAAIHFEQPLETGIEAECVTSIEDVRLKAGQSGDLVFVDLRRQIVQSSQTRVRESQTLVYRGGGASQPAIVPTAVGTATAAAWCPGPVDLFRFSAVTFNAHRIHYDAPYTRGVEGYPDLVVQGPLIAVKLLSFACRHTGRSARSFEFRLIAPVYVSQPVIFRPGEGEGAFIALRCDGTPSLTAEVQFK